MMRIDGLGGRTAPHIPATVTQISPASQSDEKTGAIFYTVRARIDPGAIDHALHRAGIAGPLRPGTPISLDIPLYRRSALEYWFSPFLQSLGV
jgi:HlyD family secretion protein